MSNVIGILGCGWLGLPLAKSFISDGYNVHGSTTSEEKIASLRKEGINPFLIRLSENKLEGPISNFLDSLEILIINVPPKLRGKNTENYVEKMQKLHKAIHHSQLKKILFISSTSVYGDVEGEVTEESKPHPKTESGRQLLSSEMIFRNDSTLQSTIIRFGGLIGPNRHPINMLSGKKGLSNGNAPVNLIHLYDCIDIIRTAHKNNWWGETFNGVYPLHPNKKDYYTLEAQKRGLPLPEYLMNSTENDKIISSYRLISVKKFSFKTSIVS